METKIMVVENDRAQYNVFSLSLINYDTIHVEDSKSVVGMVEQHNPSLLIFGSADHRIATIDAIRTLRRSEKNKYIPIIVISNPKSEEYLQDALRAGATDYLHKPFAKTELITRVNTTIKFGQYRKSLEESKNRVKEDNKELQELNSQLQDTNQALAISQDNYQRLADNIPNGIIYTINQDHQFTFISGAELQDIGLSEKLALGKRVDDVFPMEAVGILNYRHKRTFSGRAQSFEVTIGERIYLGNTTKLSTQGDENLQLQGVLLNISQQRSFYDNLKNENRFLNRVNNALPGVIFTIDSSNGKFDLTNSRLLDVLGYKNPELPRRIKHLADFIHQEDRDKACNFLEEAKNMKGGAVEKATFRILHKNQHYLWMEVYLSVFVNLMKDEKKELLGFVRDVTMERTLEVALHNNKAFLEKITSLSPNIIYILGGKTDGRRVKYLNQTAQIFLGLNGMDFKKAERSFIYTLIHPEDIPIVARQSDEIEKSADKEIVSMVLRMRNRDGLWRTVSIREQVFKRDKDGTVLEILGSGQDITELSAAEKELGKQKDFIATVNQLSPNYIYVYHLETKKSKYHNKEFKDFLGYPDNIKSSFTPDEIKNIIHPDDVSEYMEHFEAIRDLEEDETIDYNVRVKGPNNQYQWLWVREQVLTVDPTTGQADEVIGTAQNITALKESEQSLLRLNESKGNILGVVAHDLRNPINSIQGITKIMRLSNASMPPDEEQLVGMVEDSCTKALQLISELLEMAQLEDENYDFETEVQPIQPLLIEAIQPFEEGIIRKNIQLIKILPEEPVYAPVNDSKVRRVFENLISNALKFTPERGEITLEMEVRNTSVHIKVKDSGIGIPKEMQSVLFDKFSMARRRGLKGEKSTGLGMSIVKQVVDRHNGSISFESEVEKGTVFHVRLPIATQNELIPAE